MKPVINFIGLLLLCLNFGYASHQGTLEGIVFDAKTGQELAGANVQLLGTEQVAFTNDLGYFSFQDLPRGNYTLITSYLGFQTDTLAQIQLSDNASVQVRIHLEQDRIDLPAVVIQPDMESSFKTISQIDLASPCSPY